MRSAEQVPDAVLRLGLSEGLGSLLRKRCLEYFGSPEAVCAADAAQLSQVQGIGRGKAEKIYRSLQVADPDSEREEMHRYKASAVVLGDADYPRLLSAIPDPPLLLYVRGELREEDSLSLAVVGSRRCTAYGREQAGRFAGQLSERGLTIISGGARGIDTAAHQGVLRAGGRTIAVLGCGLARTYPPENGELFDEIAERGAMVSELPMRFPPLAGNFLPRNRLIAGLSLAVLVIEAARRSGALSTARQALDMGREVCALPGRVDSPASEGCHQLIARATAALVTGPPDVLQLLKSSSLSLFNPTTTPTSFTPTPTSFSSSITTPKTPTPATNSPAPDASTFKGNFTPGAADSPEGEPAVTGPGGAADGELFSPVHLNDLQKRIYVALSDDARSLAELQRLTGSGAAAVMGELTVMEVRGLVRRQGSSFVRT